MALRKDRVPAELQDLTREVLIALRPIEIDVGQEVRAQQGYRKKGEDNNVLLVFDASTGKNQSLGVQD